MTKPNAAWWSTRAGIVVKRSRYNTYIYPATHYAAPSGNTSTNLPAMGQRVRLKSAFVIPASWTKEEKAVLLGLKKYGAMVADNGNFFSISVTPDDRWPSGCFDHFTSISITNFEVIQTTGTNGGPRSPGAPVANAGPDQTVVFGQPAQLAGVVSFSNTPPVIRWKTYSGPGTVTFGNAAQTNTTATFSAPGIYTLELSADDGVHAVAYDAAVIHRDERHQRVHHARRDECERELDRRHGAVRGARSGRAACGFMERCRNHERPEHEYSHHEYGWLFPRERTVEVVEG